MNASGAVSSHFVSFSLLVMSFSGKDCLPSDVYISFINESGAVSGINSLSLAMNSLAGLSSLLLSAISFISLVSSCDSIDVSPFNSLMSPSSFSFFFFVSSILSSTLWEGLLSGSDFIDDFLSNNNSSLCVSISFCGSSILSSAISSSTSCFSSLFSPSVCEACLPSEVYISLIKESGTVSFISSSFSSSFSSSWWWSGE